MLSYLTTLGKKMTLINCNLNKAPSINHEAREKHKVVVVLKPYFFVSSCFRCSVTNTFNQLKFFNNESTGYSYRCYRHGG